MTFYEFIEKFFRINRPSEGAYFGGWHIAICTVATLLWIGLGVYLGLKNKDKDLKAKLVPLQIVAFIIVIVRIVDNVHQMMLLGAEKFMQTQIPIFLCDILVYTMPLFAFCKNEKVRNAAAEYTIVLGILAGVMGTWFNTHVYETHPAWSFVCLNSIALHTLPAFAAMYIIASKFASLKFKNIGFTYIIVAPFIVLSLICNATIKDANYMFLMKGDGTPFDLFMKMVGGNQVGYTIMVILGMAAYIAAFYAGWLGVTTIIDAVKASKNIQTDNIQQ